MESLLEEHGPGSSKVGNFANAGSNEIQDPVGNEHYLLNVTIEGITHLNRVFSIPTDATFFLLHCAIQDMFAWESDHLYAFEIGSKRDALEIGPSEPPYLLPVRLIDILGTTPKKFSYMYDFGDSWNHIITIKKIQKLDKPNPLPVAISGKGTPPPEDCGGVHGYYALKEGTHWMSEEDPEYWKEYFEKGFTPEATVFSNAKEYFKHTQGMPGF